jgi:hypothetical protein
MALYDYSSSTIHVPSTLHCVCVGGLLRSHLYCCTTIGYLHTHSALKYIFWGMLGRILMSIWRPKVELLLTVIAFILVEYYFSIILYYNFQSRTYDLCKDLQSYLFFNVVASLLCFMLHIRWWAVFPVTFSNISNKVMLALLSTSFLYSKIFMSSSSSRSSSQY